MWPFNRVAGNTRHRSRCVRPGDRFVTAPFVLISRGTPRIDFEIEDDNVELRFGKRDATLAFKRRISIPLTDISDVTTPARKSVPRHGLRLPGTEIPGFIRAGSYGRGAKREFWDVRRGETALVIDTTSAHPYARLVLEVDDPTGKAAAGDARSSAAKPADRTRNPGLGLELPSAVRVAGHATLRGGKPPCARRAHHTEVLRGDAPTGRYLNLKQHVPEIDGFAGNGLMPGDDAGCECFR